MSSEIQNMINIYSSDGKNKNAWQLFFKDINNDILEETIISTLEKNMKEYPRNEITADIIDFIIDFGSSTIINLIAQNKFLDTFINLLKSETKAGLENQKKVIYLTQKWAKKFYGNQNLSIFFQKYNFLKSNGIVFPPDTFIMNTYDKFVIKNDILISNNNQNQNQNAKDDNDFSIFNQNNDTEHINNQNQNNFNNNFNNNLNYNNFSNIGNNNDQNKFNNYKNNNYNNFNQNNNNFNNNSYNNNNFNNNNFNNNNFNNNFNNRNNNEEIRNPFEDNSFNDNNNNNNYNNNNYQMNIGQNNGFQGGNNDSFPMGNYNNCPGNNNYNNQNNNPYNPYENKSNNPYNHNFNSNNNFNNYSSNSDNILLVNIWKNKIKTLNEYIDEGKFCFHKEKLKEGLQDILNNISEIDNKISQCMARGDDDGRRNFSFIKFDMEQTCYRYQCLKNDQKCDKFNSAFDGNSRKYFFDRENLFKEKKYSLKI